MRRLRSAVTTLIVVSAVMACMAQTTLSECKSGPFSVPFLTKPIEGWDVSFVKRSSLTGRGELILDGKDSGLQYAQYAAKKQVITLPHIEVNPCNHTGTIRVWYLLPEQVMGFEKNGHLFAYQVAVQMVAGPNAESQMLGSNTHVIFYDMHGNGVFDSVRLGSGIGMPLVPAWVLGKP